MLQQRKWQKNVSLWENVRKENENMMKETNGIRNLGNGLRKKVRKGNKENENKKNLWVQMN